MSHGEASAQPQRRPWGERVGNWGERAFPPGSWARLLLLLISVTAVEAALTGLGLLQGTGPFSISPIWPAAGFAVAVTFVCGYRVMPAIALGDSLASTWFGVPLFVNGPLAIVAAGVGALGAWLMHRSTPEI